MIEVELLEGASEDELDDTVLVSEEVGTGSPHPVEYPGEVNEVLPFMDLRHESLACRLQCIPQVGIATCLDHRDTEQGFACG